MSSTSETSRSSQISRVPYLPGLDGLRALAVIAVIIYHANPAWLPGGYLGVEVFFVISGYLITLLLVAESERSGAIELRQFWVRRARRLLPALFTMLVLLIFWTAFFERDALGKLRGDVLAGVVYGSNWFQVWTGAGYTAVNDFAPLRHLWSLAVEEQFYLVWPLVMLLVLRRGHDRLPRVAMWFVGIAAVIAAVMAALMPTSPIGADCAATPGAYWEIAGRCVSRVDALYLSTPTRAMGLLLGSALALVWRPYALLRGPMKSKGPLLDPVAIIGLGIVGVLSWKVHIVYSAVDVGDLADPWLFRGGLFLTGVGSLMVIAAVAHKRALAGRVLGNPVFRVIGERSYGLYLFHWPVFQALRHETGIALKPHEFVGAMLVTIAITEFSYRYIELPIRERRLRESMGALLRGGPGALRRRGSFGAIVSASVVLSTVRRREPDDGRSEAERRAGQPGPGGGIGHRCPRGFGDDDVLARLATDGFHRPGDHRGPTSLRRVRHRRLGDEGRGAVVGRTGHRGGCPAGSSGPHGCRDLPTTGGSRRHRQRGGRSPGYQRPRESGDFRLPDGGHQ